MTKNSICAFVVASAAFIGATHGAQAMNFGLGNSCTFNTLTQAVHAAGNNGTVFVRAGHHTMQGPVTLPHNITLEGGNNTCQRTGTGARSATLDGSSLQQRMIMVPPGRRLTLLNIRITGGRGNGAGGAIFVDTGGQLGLSNASVTNSVSPNAGGCIYARDANVSLIFRSEITGCQSDGTGGGLYLDGGRLNMLAGTQISNNRATVLDGGNLYLTFTANATISGNILGGEANRDGGGIAMSRSRRTTVSPNTFGTPRLTIAGNARISGNTAGDDGGGLHLMRDENAVSGGLIEVTLQGNAEFRDNSANDRGGAISTDEHPHRITLRDDVRLLDNTAGSSGGAMDVILTAVNMQGRVRITGNEANTQGGGIHAHNESTLTIDGVSLDAPIEISDNHISNPKSTALRGAGISLDGSELDAMFLELEGNDIFGGFSRGGGVSAFNSTAKLENSAIRTNSASVGGGISASGGSRLILRSIYRSCAVNGSGNGSGNGSDYCSTVSGNIANGSNVPLPIPGMGGGIHISGNTSVDIRTTEFNFNSASGTNTVVGRGGAFGVSTDGGQPSILLLNTMITDNHRPGNEIQPALYANGGALTVRNSTFFENNQVLDWESAVTGVFNNNLVQDNNGVTLVWPGSVQGRCNLFDDNATPLPGGTGNVIGNASLDSNGHPTQFATNVIDQCGQGPAFDIMGTRRPVNGAHDIGAVEFVP